MSPEKIKILAIDTSCDDTSVAVLEDDRVLSSVVSSQDNIHHGWGGVVPLLAKRAHQEFIDQCLQSAMKRARIKNFQELHAIAVTYGPGLAPSLEVGIDKTKQLAQEYKIPAIGVNHMEGHILSPLLKNSSGNYYSPVHSLDFPLVSLVVSGGHTEIVWIEKIGSYKILGKTLDDAAGEAMDKVARMLGLGYPGGAIIENMAKQGDPKKYDLPRPMLKSNNYDFSFSGLKTACLYSTNSLKEEKKELFPQIIPDYCASFQEAVVDTLLGKLLKVIQHLKPKAVLVGGGVSKNNRLRKKLRFAMQKRNMPIYFPHKKFCMDNAAMIGLCAYHKYQRGEVLSNPLDLDRAPNLCL